VAKVHSDDLALKIPMPYVVFYDNLFAIHLTDYCVNLRVNINKYKEKIILKNVLL